MKDGAAPFATTLSSWMSGHGPSSDVVISTRIRLARNLRGFLFPPVADRETEEAVVASVGEAMSSTGPAAMDYSLYPLREIEQIDQWVLVEKHLVSPHLVEKDGCTGIILDEDEVISVMINEEDHLRIQCLLPGLELTSALERADRMDDLLASKLPYALHKRYGYLTACPSNLGTGMRGSVMVHLPGLVLTGQMESLMSGLNKVGAVVRGVYGEGSDAQGNLFQISNRASLGSSESEIVDNLYALARELIGRERSAREALLSGDRYEIEDRVYRSYGLLTHARKMDSSEAIGLLSMVRLGSDLNILSTRVGDAFPELMVRMRRASLQRVLGERLDAGDRDVERASFIRKRLQAH